MLLMVTDTAARILKSGNIHFENASNEILNSDSLAELVKHLKEKNLNAVFDMISKYEGKVKKLGQNFNQLLSSGAADQRDRARQAGNHRRHGPSAGALFRHVGALLDEPADPPRSRGGKGAAEGKTRERSRSLEAGELTRSSAFPD